MCHTTANGLPHIQENKMSDFYRTVMGHTFFDSTLPNLVAQLKRLNDLLERALVLAEREFNSQGKENK